MGDFLEFGWPVNLNRSTILVDTQANHPSATQHDDDVRHYIEVELAHRALAGPFEELPVPYFHTSPLMTRTKKDSVHRWVIMDLSWPKGFAINDSIDPANYLDGPANIKLPTADCMVDRLLLLGDGAFMYKTDLARGYRQLRVDPWDWPLLGFRHGGRCYMDLCPPPPPPLGLRTSAMCM